MTVQVTLSPVFNDTQFCDNDGNPLSGGKIFTYEAGSNSVEQLTYTTSAGSIEAANPIVLDSSGRLPNEIWLISGSAYNLVLTLADGTTVLTSVDDVRGSVPTAPGGGFGSVIWNPAETAPDYISSTFFSLTGDVTYNYQIGNRVRYQFSDLTYGFATVLASAYADPATQVQIEPDSLGFNNTVLNVAWSALVTNGKTVDAGAVTFTDVITYAGANVGAELQAIKAMATARAAVYATTGGPSIFAVTIPLAGDLTDSIWYVRFNQVGDAAGSDITINGNQYAMKAFSSNGSMVNTMVAQGQVTGLAYDATNDVVIVTSPVQATATGTIACHGSLTAPEGWVVCDGSSYSTTTYADLFNVIAYTFGGAGANFNVPDMRGRFARGFDTTNAIDPGRVFGSTQAGQMESHNHSHFWINYDGGGGRGLVDPVNPLNITVAGQSTAGYTGWGVSFAGTGTETRPTNVALTYCIKL